MKEERIDTKTGKLIIPTSKDADTRSSTGEVTKKSLLQNTYSHIEDVNVVGEFLTNKITEQLKEHDYTKVQYIDEFYQDFTSGKKGAEFKALPWWQIHMTERHHLNDSVPKDVNLIDVLEMVIDCTVAGLARSGSVYDIEIPQNVLKQAINNTKQLIIDNTVVKDMEVKN